MYPKKGKDFIMFALDVDSAKTAISCVTELGEEVGFFKIGLELFIRSGPELVKHIRDVCSAGIFLDLKLHDIPVTVKRAMQGIAEMGVDLTTVHCGESRKMLEMAVEGSRGKVGVLGVTLLTSVGEKELHEAGFSEKFAFHISSLVQMRAAAAFEAGCRGVVCSGLEAAEIKKTLGKDFLVITPGIRPSWEVVNAEDQHRITTPSKAVAWGADYIVVGRPIRDAENPRQAAREIAREIESAVGLTGD
jgi:orotidine-5'-phosphate decarboxylase